jgi:hypothetical protein
MSAISVAKGISHWFSGPKCAHYSGKVKSWQLDFALYEECVDGVTL